MWRKWLVMVMLACVPVVSAQTDYAAVIEVIYPGVTIQRANTRQSLPLAPESVAVFGVGDTLHTDSDGRAYLTFDDDFSLLIMPDSTFTLTRYTAQTFAAHIDGHAIHRSAAFDTNYTLTVGENVTITRPADHFALWTDFEGTPVIIPAQGTLILEADGETLEVNAGHGFYVHDGEARTAAIEAPASAARLIGQELGCTGTVDIQLDRLNLRAGTGLGFLEIAFIEDGGTVQLMGINESSSWVRVQRFSGFGWSQALAIKHTCDLPVYPNVTGENNVDMFGVAPLELPLLTPFYGEPDENIWFYRSLR